MGLFMDFKAPVEAQWLSVTIAEDAERRTETRRSNQLGEKD